MHSGQTPTTSATVLRLLQATGEVMRDTRTCRFPVALCLLLSGCFDPSALESNVMPDEVATESAPDEQQEREVVTESSGASPVNTAMPPATVSEETNDLQWMAVRDPLTDEEFAAVWPRIKGTWMAVREDAFAIENGAVNRIESEALPPQLITMVIDDNEFKTIRMRRGQASTGSTDVADLHQRVRDGSVTLDGDELYFLLIEAEEDGGRVTSKHYLVLSRE